MAANRRLTDGQIYEIKLLRVEEEQTQSNVLGKHAKRRATETGKETFNSVRVDATASREDHLIHRIGEIPVIVEEIFHHLPMQDLCNCAKVCKMWNGLSQRAKKGRHQFSGMFWMNQNHEPKFTTHISNVLRQAFSHPRTAILFATSTFFNEQAGIDGFIGSSNVSESSLVDNLKAELPHGCRLLGVSTARVIGSSVSPEKTRAFTCLLLPEVPGVDVYSFILDDDRYGYRFREEELPRLTNIPKHAKVKCMILLGYPFLGLMNNFFVEPILKKQNSKFAVGGGNGYTLVAPEHVIRGNRMPHKIGIAFCGENVEAASVLLDGDEDLVCSTLMQLKSFGFPEDRSFAFAFATEYPLCNVDAHVRVFRKLFPKTPLFGGVFEWSGVGFKNFVSSKDLRNENYNYKDDFHAVSSTLVVFISLIQ